MLVVLVTSGLEGQNNRSPWRHANRSRTEQYINHQSITGLERVSIGRIKPSKKASSSGRGIKTSQIGAMSARWIEASTTITASRGTQRSKSKGVYQTWDPSSIISFRVTTGYSRVLISRRRESNRSIITSEGSFSRQLLGQHQLNLYQGCLSTMNQAKSYRIETELHRISEHLNLSPSQSLNRSNTRGLCLQRKGGLKWETKTGVVSTTVANPANPTNPRNSTRS